MPRIERLGKLPPNFGEFVGEIAEGLAALYGGKAAAEYCKTADREVLAAIRHDSVDAIAAWDGDGAAAFLLAVLRGGIGRISFAHVLRRYAGRNIERRLVEECVRTFRAKSVEGITSECVAFCPLEVDEVYADLRFERIERAMMIAPLDAPDLASGGEPTSIPCRESYWAEVAETIVAAYARHPGRKLHVEVRRKEAALDFIQSAASGGYGKTRPEYIRAVEVGGRYVGAAVGCEVSPVHGFILQVAVLPGYCGQGIGTRLVRDMAAAFRQAGRTHSALGVTMSDPALALYKRLGFGIVRPVTAYTWWRM